MGYTTKELSQLFDQSNSIQTSKQIVLLIKLTKLSKRLFWVFIAMFIGLWILSMIK